MAEKAKKEAMAKSAANNNMAPINLFYNRNPVLCIPYIPITQVLLSPPQDGPMLSICYQLGLGRV